MKQENNSQITSLENSQQSAVSTTDSKILKIEKINQKSILDFDLGWKEFYDALGLTTNKGLLLMGETGIGKTTLMHKLVRSRPTIGYGHPDRNLFIQEPPLRDFTAIGIATYCRRHGMIPMLGIYEGYDVFIDDIGTEPSSVNEFGNLIFPVADFIELRYNQFKTDKERKVPEHPNVMHFFTTNLSSEELKKVYGRRVFERLYEMCHFLEIEGTSLRFGNT